MTEVPRVVIDCNTFLQALASPEGPAGECVELAMQAKVRLFISPHVLAELREVSARPQVVRKMHLVPERVEDFLEALGRAATLLEGFPVEFRYNRDPDDAHY